MRRSRLSVRVLPLSAALLLAPELSGQGWVNLPNGELGYITDLTTTGFFHCGDPLYLIGSCQVSGNSITLGSGGSFMTMTFQGLSQIIMASNVSQPVRLGTVTKTFSGSGPFLFPTSTNFNVPLFSLYMQLNLTSPLAKSARWGAGYLPLSRTTIPKSCCDYLPDWVPFATLPPPQGYTYGAFSFDGFFGTTMTATREPTNVYANVGILPEPATIWLTGTGIVGILAALHRRRRSRTDAT